MRAIGMIVAVMAGAFLIFIGALYFAGSRTLGQFGVGLGMLGVGLALLGLAVKLNRTTRST